MDFWLIPINSLRIQRAFRTGRYISIGSWGAFFAALAPLCLYPGGSVPVKELSKTKASGKNYFKNLIEEAYYTYHL